MSDSNALAGPQSTVFPPDVLEMLLADKRSENTRRAYRHDLRQFFLALYEAEPSPALIAAFLQQPSPVMVTQILRYKARLIGEKQAEATVNRRLVAIQSLVRFARRVGATEANLDRQVDTEKVVTYRDTRGITTEQARQLLRLPDRATPKGRRDFALMLLMLENALRRAEIVSLKLADFDAEGRILKIRGKGRGTQQENVTLSPVSCNAILAYLETRTPSPDSSSPLFATFQPGDRARGLTADGLYKALNVYAKRINLCLSPHRLRHTAITMALDASGGDIRRVQRLSRHARLETLQIYDDNRSDLQGEMTNALSQILDG